MTSYILRREREREREREIYIYICIYIYIYIYRYLYLSIYLSIYVGSRHDPHLSLFHPQLCSDFKISTSTLLENQACVEALLHNIPNDRTPLASFAKSPNTISRRTQVLKPKSHVLKRRGALFSFVKAQCN